MSGLLALVIAAATVVPRFAMDDNPIALRGPARPHAFVEASGRRAAFLGREDGSFEAWIHPLKILHDFELAFEIARYASPIEGRSLATSVDIRPESVTIRYTHDSFTVDAVWFVPLDEAGGVVLLDVESSEDVTVHVRFRTDLELMWPGGLGGQYSYWEGAHNGYVVTESTRSYAAIVGSPFASEPAGQPAHNLPDAVTSFQIPISVDTARSGLVPVVIAASVDGLEPALSTYERLQSQTEADYREAEEHYRALREERVSIDSPDDALDLALEWGKIALDKGFTCNPQLGCGLVAGWGPSGSSARPGFGWFFGGDAFMNMWAMTAYGDYETVEQSLRFLVERQRDDGKMMHELSQSAATLSWFEDFPYGYYHADTTPLYLVAVRDYLAASGRDAFVRELWPSLSLAYDYCLSADDNGDGLMDNTAAGLAAVETGALRSSELLTDVYLASAWTAATDAYADIANMLGESERGAAAASDHRRARESLNSIFVADELSRIQFALMSDGSAQGEVTVWPALGLWHGGFDAGRDGVAGALDRLASSEVGTDWGARMLSRESALYSHESYNNGAVWPFVTGFAAMALYEHGRDEAGFAYLDGLKEVTFLGDRGYIPELLSGDRLSAVDAAVPHQLFASAGFVTTLLNGLVGRTSDGIRPRIPAGWDFLHVRNLRWKDDVHDFSWTRTGRPKLEPDGPVVEMPTGADFRVRPVTSPLREGDSSSRLRVLETTRSEDTVTVRLEGRTGEGYGLIVDSIRPVESVSLGRLVDGMIELTLPDGPTPWTRVELVVRLSEF